VWLFCPGLKLSFTLPPSNDRGDDFLQQKQKAENLEKYKAFSFTKSRG